MTTLLGGQDLPRPAAAPDAGPLDDRLYDLVETRVRRLFTDNPIMATYFGIHSEDHRLGDAGRDAVEHEIAADKAHLAAVEALDPAGLSAGARFERDLELHNVRLALFDADEVRRWERRSQAAGDIGDAVFALFARGAAPARRSGSTRIADRLEGVPAFLAQARSRAVGPQVGLWQKVELRYAKDLPGLFAEVREAAEEVLDARELARLDRAIHVARTALEDHIAWLDGTLADRDRGLAAGPRALRRAGPAARVRRPGRGRDPRDRLGPAAHEHRGAPRRRPRAGPRRGPAVRHRAPQGGPPGHLRGRPRGLQGRDAPLARLPHRARHRHDPGRRGHRRHRHAGVPAQRHAVRGLLLAGPLRRRPARHLRRHAGRRQRPQRDAASTTTPRSRTPASTRRTRATTSSSRWRPSTRA